MHSFTFPSGIGKFRSIGTIFPLVPIPIHNEKVINFIKCQQQCLQMSIEKF